MIEKVKNEPVLTAASGSAAIIAVIHLLRSFGLVIGGDEQSALLEVWGTVGTMALAWWARRRVSPQANSTVTR